MTIKCVSPIDDSVVFEKEPISPEEAMVAVQAAQEAQAEWASLTIDERIRFVRAGVEVIGEMNDEIVTELAWQMGRPIKYGGEFGGFKERAEYMASIAHEALQDINIEDTKSFGRYIRRQPHGVVLVIAPWNYPYMTAINTIAPALIAGNTIILKHASQTPLVGQRIEQAFHKAGIPKNVIQNLLLDHQTTTKLISQKMFGFVNFTGSVRGGKEIEKAAAGTFTNLGLELGGKDPAYVMEDADIDNAVDTLVDGAMFNSGQCCCGIERIYVTQNKYDEFTQKAVELVKQYKLGNPLEQETTLGPMAKKGFAEQVRGQINDAVRDGARPNIQTFEEDDGGAYLSPQILTNVTHDMKVMKEESFGPVVGIMKTKNDGEAIQMMNDSPFGLTASLWTNDPERAEKIGKNIQTGTVFLNRCDYLDPALCWTGCKQTGRGGALSVIGYHNLTRPQSFHLKKS